MKKALIVCFSAIIAFNILFLSETSAQTNTIEVQNSTMPGNPAQTSSSEPALESLSPRWKSDVIDTTSAAGYLSETERQVIIEINLVRTDPGEYARRFIAPLRAYFHGSLLEYPGEIAISTDEGPLALDECIKELAAAKPQSPLSPREGLTLAAREHALDQSKTGVTGHSGGDGSTMLDRMSRYGNWDFSSGENIDYGNGDARRIVISLLIDDGVKSRGHRKNLMSGSFRVVGVAVGPHPVYEYMCVIDFAGDYK
jgi:uncharacterized protein YkwD